MGAGGSCQDRTLASAAGGGALGAATGVFKSIFDLTQATPRDHAEAATSKAGRGVLARVAKQIPVVTATPVATIVGYAAIFGGAAAVYSMTQCYAKRQDGVAEWQSVALGGCAAGATYGLRTGKWQTTLGGCGGVAAFMTGVEILGDGHLFPKQPTVPPRKPIVSLE